MTARSGTSYQLKALTDIWTGDRTGKPDRLITTGLLGSIRWWCEVVVRGLGGSACDPSNTQVRCPDRQGRRCVVCELFGCTSWARKFRLDVLDANGHTKTTQIKKGDPFALRFTPLRPIAPEEWALLDVTLRLIGGYGAIGGKTIYKPTDENARQNAAHHRDYGIVSVERAPNIAPVDLEKLRSHVGDRRWRRVEGDGFAWATLASFWSVTGRYLARQDADRSTFNRVIGRPEPKGRASQGDSWLAGRRAGGGQQPESKKVFSVKEPPRTFGFTNGGQLSFDAIKTKLRSAWPDLKDAEIRTGDAIANQLVRARSA
jgi:CRISPR-associated protein Cmr1